MVNVSIKKHSEILKNLENAMKRWW
jgi:hypothetical protein